MLRLARAELPREQPVASDGTDNIAGSGLAFQIVIEVDGSLGIGPKRIRAWDRPA